MSISIFVTPVSKGAELVEELLNQEFGIRPENARHLYEKCVKPHFDRLKETIFLLAETNYVDRVFRDSFYNYYASKLKNYKRDCIRISLFEGGINETDFRDPAKRAGLQANYRGFFVLRPIEPFVIGRNIISPHALKNAGFLACTAEYQTTANGIKFKVEGFPHSSQDTETISCAETALWTMMEYFGHKYSDYRTVLPSHIIHTLNKVSSERQVPSKGLNIQQMSFALREFGFGTRIYSRAEYGNDFEALISCYVESGIPVITAMENRPQGNIGHALLCVGHERISDVQIDNLLVCHITENRLQQVVTSKKIGIYDIDAVEKPFVFIDDNHPVYQKATLKDPAIHYKPDWHNCRIAYFIVPLYSRIYLEAFEAKNFIKRFLIIGPNPLADGSEVLLRCYLASSRSFKDWLAQNQTFQNDLKDIILETSMPKFIWAVELSTKSLVKQKKANGLVILDATEANIYFNKPLIIAAFQGKVINFVDGSGVLENSELILPEFTIFDRNLKAF